MHISTQSEIRRIEDVCHPSRRGPAVNHQRDGTAAKVLSHRTFPPPLIPSQPFSFYVRIFGRVPSLPSQMKIPRPFPPSSLWPAVNHQRDGNAAKVISHRTFPPSPLTRGEPSAGRECSEGIFPPHFPCSEGIFPPPLSKGSTFYLFFFSFFFTQPDLGKWALHYVTSAHQLQNQPSCVKLSQEIEKI